MQSYTYTDDKKKLCMGGEWPIGRVSVQLKGSRVFRQSRKSYGVRVGLNQSSLTCRIPLRYRLGQQSCVAKQIIECTGSVDKEVVWYQYMILQYEISPRVLMKIGQQAYSEIPTDVREIKDRCDS